MIKANLKVADVAPSRIIIADIEPSVNRGLYPIKRCLGERVDVKAIILCDGHDELSVQMNFWHEGQTESPKKVNMKTDRNDGWLAKFQVTELGTYYFQVETWVDRFNTWRKKALKKLVADQLEKSDVLEGIDQLEQLQNDFARLSAKQIYTNIVSFLRDFADQPTATIEFEQQLLSHSLIEITQQIVDQTSFQKSHELAVTVEVAIAGFSNWYEFFPRSLSTAENRHGTFQDASRYLSYVASLGFHVVYLPPIHPIGKTYRKGKNNSPISQPQDVGCPWAIGDETGGHKAIHSELGDFDDFAAFVRQAKELKMQVALDIAFQCSPDHPYVNQHPEWLYQRPDGSIHYAENPPKKYQDIYPINFESPDWQNLWNELKSVFIFWCEKDVKIFRVDNPHTKSFPFWQWCIQEVRKEFPDTVFLSEAFTRPHRMYWLAKAGFSQSYTYFTWRHSKQELIQYMEELRQPPICEVFRPNFWPNTPDILATDLRHQDRPSFIKRLILAATLSSNYGIYGPAFELCLNQALDPSNEEYLDSEKYELKSWPTSLPPGHLGPIIKRINGIRNTHPALQKTGNHVFLKTDHDEILAYLKFDVDHLDYLLVVVNLNSHDTISSQIHLPRNLVPLDPENPLDVHDLIGDEITNWHGEHHKVEINPYLMPAQIFHILNIVQPQTDELA